MRGRTRVAWLVVIWLSALVPGRAQQAARATLPAGPLTYGAFVASFPADGTFTIEGQGWPKLAGTWTMDGTTVTLTLASGPRGCDAAGRYAARVSGTRLTFALVEDACTPRRMILDRSEWRPVGEAEPRAERAIVSRAADTLPPLPPPASADGSWPSFRGPRASGVADGQQLPDTWNVATGENILWKIPIPGLAHSSPIVWGDTVYVTTAISSRADATFRPGLYGDGDASDDRSSHKWVLYAVDRKTGRIRWERVATEGTPVSKRHVKSTYASATPATDGRIVVASFGSQGLYAYDVTGAFRWSVNLGHLNMGAYDIPSFEWGPASSPIVWNGLVIVQCDTQQDSFLLALDAATGAVRWKTEREELPSWGTPSVFETRQGHELVTNASNFVRGYDPETGRERWRLGPTSKITAPTPIFSDGLIVVASGRGPERPIFVVRPGASGDVTPAAGATTSDHVAWSKTGRGSYMPTPLAYRGQLYVLANNGVFDAYDLATGAEVFRARTPEVGSGFSASPVAADGKIYLSGEDGDIFVVEGGTAFKAIAANDMGELLMATPALSNGVMFVRTVSSLVAIGRK